MDGKPRVRFAPSPTGVLHVGGVRTALFNWLFARHMGGVFILRIDDTDAVRSTDENMRNIIDSMLWLGLDWDEGVDPADPSKDRGPLGPYRQSRKFDHYRAEAERLLAGGKAFKCYCSAEELEAKRQAAARQKLAPRYDGRCLNLTDAERAELEKQGRKPALRFRLPEGRAVVLDDMIKGRVEFPHDVLDHFIILRSDGKPVYNFTTVVDEADHRITHVIRGDDHVSNTPKQILIGEALGYPCPRFAHLPQILGLDRSRLSKRKGAPGVIELKEAGYLREAVINFLALMGWSYNEKDELFTPPELVEKFDLARVGTAPAVFDEQKLEWMNGVYIRKAPPGTIEDDLMARMAAAYGAAASDRAYAGRVAGLLKDGLKALADVIPASAFFFQEEVAWDEDAHIKLVGWPKVAEILAAVGELVKAAEPFTPPSLEARFRAAAEAAGLKFKDYVHPTRFALTGRAVGPSLFHLMEILGRDRCLKRIAAARSDLK